MESAESELNKYDFPKCYLFFFKNAIFGQHQIKNLCDYHYAPSCWNSLPGDLRDIFKHKLKTPAFMSCLKVLFILGYFFGYF